MPQGHRTPMTRTQRAQLSAFIRDKADARRATRAHPSTSSLEPERPLHRPDRRPVEPLGFWFSPQRHGLTLEQCRLAQQRLWLAQLQRPIRGGGRQAAFRRAMRVAGILSAIRNGRVHNSRWGRSMLATRGGKASGGRSAEVMRQMGPRARGAAKGARLRKEALKAWEQRQQQPQSPVEQLLAEAPQELPSSLMAW